MRLAAEKFYGNLKLENRLENFHLSITTYIDEVEIPFHSHTNPYLSINMGCPYKETDRSSSKVVQTGEVIFRPSNYEHKNLFSKNNGVCFNIEIVNFPNPAFLELFSKVSKKKSCLQIHKVCLAIVHNFNDDELDCLIHEVLMEDLQCSNSRQIPPWYKMVKDYINDNYNEPMTLRQLSNVASVHPHYLSRKFKKINGRNISEYIRKVRVKKAFELMTLNQQSLTQISLDAGFYDQSHFIRTFKTIYGCNPNNFKLKYKRLISYN